jgi:diazepam-binding inhibitor (GABA receptor modulating acyl-CoA-binding protein)
VAGGQDITSCGKPAGRVATLLQLYALFKQASGGDVEGRRPGFTDLVGRAKYDAWAAIKGTSSDAAMQQYIALVNRLQAG